MIFKATQEHETLFHSTSYRKATECGELTCSIASRPYRKMFNSPNCIIKLFSDCVSCFFPCSRALPGLSVITVV